MTTKIQCLVTAFFGEKKEDDYNVNAFLGKRILKVGSNLQSNIAFTFEGKSYEVLEHQFILFRYFVSNEKFT